MLYTLIILLAQHKFVLSFADRRNTRFLHKSNLGHLNLLTLTNALYSDLVSKSPTNEPISLLHKGAYSNLIPQRITEDVSIRLLGKKHW